MKNAKIEFKLDQEMYENFKDHCNENGYDMSKRLRLFISKDISKKYKEVSVTEVKVEPESKIEKVEIMGKEYVSIKRPPNIFVVKSVQLNDDENIIFNLNDKNYRLEKCIYDKVDDYYIIECRNWEISYVG